jgi:toxin ParE1/3/4
LINLVFTVEAKADLDDLSSYLSERSPQGLRNATAHLEQKIKLAMKNPKIARPAPLAGVREIVDAKYGFVIPYFVDSDVFYVLRIYHGARRPLDYSAVTLP